MNSYIAQLEDQNSHLQERLAIAEKENYINGKILEASWGPIYHPPTNIGDDIMTICELRNDFYVLATVSKYDNEDCWRTNLKFYNVPLDNKEYKSFDEARQWVEKVYNDIIEDIRKTYDPDK